MTPIKIQICLGTACVVMGGRELQNLEDMIPAKWKGLVDIEGVTCLSLCKDRTHGKAPFVKVDGEIIEQASVDKIMRALTKKIG